MEGVLQRDLQIIAQVGAAPRLRPAAAAAHELAEHALEDVGEAAEVLRPCAALPLEGGVAEAVVGSALLRVLKDLIGFADRLELAFGILAPAVLVRVILHRKLAVRRLDRRIVRAALAFEQLVIIDGGGHSGPRTKQPPPSREQGWRLKVTTLYAFALSSTSENSASTTSSFGASPESPDGEASDCACFS